MPFISMAIYRIIGEIIGERFRPRRKAPGSGTEGNGLAAGAPKLSILCLEADPLGLSLD